VPRRQAAITAALVVAAVVLGAAVGAGHGPSSTTVIESAGSAATHAGAGPSHVAAGSDPKVLALNVLIADDGNNRLISVSPRGQLVWQLAQFDPGQVFLTRTGRTLLIAQSGKTSMFLMRRVDNHDLAYVYGRAGKPGPADGQLNDPQTALEAPSGRLVVADLGNCRVLLLGLGTNLPIDVLGRAGRCVHHVDAAPITFGEPDAAFPTAGGGLVVTERSPAFVDVFASDGRLKLARALIGFSAPSDANETAAGKILVTDRTKPGRVVELDGASGAELWSYGPASGAGELDLPTLARGLPNGDVLVTDTGNDRVVVVDPHTDAIVWQYGQTGVAGSAPGQLDAPGSATPALLGR
jgi:DNA-binding beta-propeller fold protein YncE